MQTDIEPPGAAPAAPDPTSATDRLHPDVLSLGWVSLLTDLSSEMIFSVFAVVFTSVAGASTAVLGLVEGLADLSASSLNYLSGWSSDRSGRRKPLAVAGYGFSTLAKALLLLGSSAGLLALFRVVERLGKSLRGPPRDAWLAGVAGHARRGWAFGVHKALDKAGAVIGPLLAFGLLSLLGESAADYQMLFWLALLPALASVLLLLRVTEHREAPRARESLRSNLRALSPEFRRFVTVAALFALGYFSFGFLLLKAHQSGFALRHVVLLYALVNLAAALSAPLSGRLGDRIGRRRLLCIVYAAYGLLCLGFALADRPWQLVPLFAVYGIFQAAEDAQAKAFVADLEPQRRASAIGLYMMVCGLMYLPASLLAGLLWTWRPEAAFLWSAGCALVALVAMIALLPLSRRGPAPPPRR